MKRCPIHNTGYEFSCDLCLAGRPTAQEAYEAEWEKWAADHPKTVQILVKARL